MDERRKDKRMPINREHFVVHGNNIGRIDDMGMGGFRCQCIAKSDAPATTSADCEISFSDLEIRLHDMPIDTVWETISFDSPFSSVLMKNCGLRFGELTSSQETQLKQLIGALKSNND